MFREKAILLNARGQHVCKVPLPPFRVPAQGILWGERFFRIHEMDSDGNLVYREGLLWVVPPETEVEI
jgi:hypothetical protein